MAQILNSHWTDDSAKAFLFRIAFDFVTQLERMMDAEGVNASELAKRLGVSKGRVSQIMNNPGNLTLKTIVDWSRALGVKVAIVAYGDGDPGNDKGPVNPQIFARCWERAGRPTDFFEAEIAVASTGDPVDAGYLRNVRLARLERFLAAGPVGNGEDPWRGKMLVVRGLKPSGVERDAGTNAA